jgi:Spy/CpxP family protein refolding chaperone
MRALRESHREKVMDLLTPEQKKWVEENSKNPREK